MKTETPERHKAFNEMETIEAHMGKVAREITSLEAQHRGLLDQWHAARDRWLALGMEEAKKD